MERFDGIYTEIAKEAGSMERLLDSFMSFLLRRTDFFYEADPGDKMGFPPGACESMLVSSFMKHQAEHYKTHPKKSVEAYRSRVAEMAQMKSDKGGSKDSAPVPTPQTPPGPTDHSPVDPASPPNPKLNVPRTESDIRWTD